MKTPLRLWTVAWLVLATVAGGRAASYTITNAPGWNLIANQLDSPNGNSIGNVLPPASVPNLSRLMKFNLATKTFNGVETRTISPISGQPIWQPGTNILNPGDGLIFSNWSSTPLLMTLSGNPHVPVLPLGIWTGLVLVARQTNALASITNILGYNPRDFTAVYRFNPGTGRDPNVFAPPHYTVYALKDGVWTDPNGAPFPIRLGEAVWVTTNGSLPVITSLSSNQVVGPGSTALFSVGATGTPPLSYQWYHGLTAIGPATNSAHSFPATVSDLGDYQAVVSNPFGSVTSSIVTLSFARVDIALSSTPSNVTLTFPERWQLQNAPTATGPWATISNVVSPASLSSTGTQGYFRLMQ